MPTCTSASSCSRSSLPGEVALAVADYPGAGTAVMLFACGSMVAAGVVLVTRNPRFARAAMVQILPPLLAIIAALLTR